jgi:aryl-alcohol dehydrogenase-like predicted oxidoreductase
MSATTMPNTRLGRTGLHVSRLCLGTMTFGLQTDEKGSFAILDKALAGGIHFIDTADVYPLGGGLEHVGRTEAIIGEWMASRQVRGRIVLATKGVGRMGPAAWDEGASRKHLLDAIDASLKRLRTDHVDLYQLHHDDRSTPLDEALEALATIVRSGRARYVGVSNFFAWRVAKALGLCDLRALPRIVCLQPRYNLLFRQPERELFPLVAEEGLGVIAYNPLAGGLLTGKHAAGVAPVAGSRFGMPNRAAQMYKDRYWHEREFDTVAALREEAARAGEPLTRMAIAWVLANPAITSAIVGASLAEQLDDSLAAASVTLDAATLKRLDELTAVYRLGDALR